jgi:hypothetical protein
MRSFFIACTCIFWLMSAISALDSPVLQYGSIRISSDGNNFDNAIVYTFVSGVCVTLPIQLYTNQANASMLIYCSDASLPRDSYNTVSLKSSTKPLCTGLVSYNMYFADITIVRGLGSYTSPTGEVTNYYAQVQCRTPAPIIPAPWQLRTYTSNSTVANPSQATLTSVYAQTTESHTCRPFTNDTGFFQVFCAQDASHQLVTFDDPSCRNTSVRAVYNTASTWGTNLAVLPYPGPLESRVTLLCAAPLPFASSSNPIASSSTFASSSYPIASSSAPIASSSLIPSASSSGLAAASSSTRYQFSSSVTQRTPESSSTLMTAASVNHSIVVVSNDAPHGWNNFEAMVGKPAAVALVVCGSALALATVSFVRSRRATATDGFQFAPVPADV